MSEKSRITQFFMSPHVKSNVDKKHRYFISMVLMIFILIAYPIVSHNNSEESSILAIMFTVLLFSMIRAVCTRRWELYLGRFLIIGGLGFSVIGRFTEGETQLLLLAASNLSFILFICYVIVITLQYLFHRGKITMNILYGAVSVYFLLGYLWAFIYIEILLFNHEAIAIADAVDSAREVWAEMLYFSFVTLTTTGYGEITPVSPLARSMAVLEAITGVLYTTILIGRFAGMVTISNKNEKEPVE